MRPKTKSKEQLIEELEAENLELAKRCCDLKIVKHNLGDSIRALEAELEAEKERYADLLERHIAMMERTVRINEQRAD